MNARAARRTRSPALLLPLLALTAGTAFAALDMGTDYDWTATGPAGARAWRGVAASADGSRLLAAALNDRLYLSVDGGISWAETRPAGDTNAAWHGAACSENGLFLAAGQQAGRLYTSQDGGATWTERRPAGDADHDWEALACSDSGTHLIAGVSNADDGRLYTSADGGATWTERRPAGDTNHDWDAVACSSDGTVMAAVVQGGRVYVSVDAGATWSERQPAGDANLEWQTVCCSSHGGTLAVAAALPEGSLYVSNDRGETWSLCDPSPDIAQDWRAVACAGDGAAILAGAVGRVFLSTDHGASWTEQQPAGDTDRPWLAATPAVNGAHFLLADGAGSLYHGLSRVTGYVSQLFYEAWDATTHQVWRCNEDGSAEIPLFADARTRLRPAVSPDGLELAYILRDGGTSWVAVASTAGFDERLLTFSTTAFGFASVNWHPDGERLIYVERSFNGTINQPGARDGWIYTIDKYGGSRTLLTGNYDYDKHYAVYSPDGATICHSRNETTWYAFPQNLFLLDGGTLEETRLTSHGSGESLKAFLCRYAPDGGKLVYQQGWNYQGNSSIWTVRPDGGGGREIIDKTWSSEGPAFRADGRRIFFGRTVNSTWQLYTALPDGSSAAALTQSPAFNRSFPCHAVVPYMTPPPPPQQVGYLRCTIQPPRAAAQGAQWRIGPPASDSWYGSGETSDPLLPAAGPYMVEFANLGGWVAPAPLTGVVVIAGQTVDVAAAYVPDGMVQLPGGTFEMGIADGMGGHTVTLGDFRIDDREVTVADFQAFCAATEQPMPPPPPWGWANTELPMVNVTWNQAAAYAAWTGKRLPTEAELEYAMRGGHADRRYPWGTAISSEDANYGDFVGLPTPAGSYAPNDYGLYDVSGNVWEWCADWFQDVLTGPVTDPVGPGSGTDKCLRGGSWVNSERRLRCAPRYHFVPDVRYIDVGFRCAAAPLDALPGETQARAVPDWWVYWNFGLEYGGPDGGFEPAADFDRDGMSDADEYAARTDPREAASRLELCAADRGSVPGTLVIRWASAAGAVYRVERAVGMGGAFRTVADALPATPPLNEWTDTAPPPPDGIPVLYRVGIDPSP